MDRRMTRGDSDGPEPVPGTHEGRKLMPELAPVEYIVIDFPGSKFDGSIVPALVDLVDKRIVRILDLVFVKKDDNGDILVFEFDQLDEIGDFSSLEGEAGDFLSDDDVLGLAEDIPLGSSALFIVWEDLWAADLGRAIRDAGGEVLIGGRLPHGVVTDIISSIESQEVPS
jgi:uncharacterized membrane protein